MHNHNGKHQRHMAASCTYHLPPSASCATKGKEKVFLRAMFLERNEKEEWSINSKMTRGKRQQDYAEEEKGRRRERGNPMKAMMYIPDRRETSDTPSLPSRESLTRQFSTRNVLSATVITPHLS